MKLNRIMLQANPRHALAAVLALAFFCRSFIALHFSNFPAPDEIYQYFGQAHRLVFGHTVIPWEFEVGLRSWLIPLLLAGPMEAARLTGFAPWAGIDFIKLLTAALSMVVVLVAIDWGWKFHGLRGAMLCGIVAGLWPDLLVMAPHPQEDTLGAYVLIAALYLIEPWPAAPRQAAPRLATPQPAVIPRGRTLWRTALAGALLGLAFVLRNPLAPGIAVAGIALCRKDTGKWMAALGAGGTIFLLAGLLDWATWGVPFRSFIMNYTLNISEGVASFFGREGNLYYPKMLLEDWLWALPFAIGFGAAILPVTSMAAFAILLLYLATAHKEFRFLFPVIALLVPVAGIGLSRIAARLSRSACLIAAAILASGLALSISSRISVLQIAAAAQAEMTLYPWHPARVGITSWKMPSDLYFGSRTRLVAISNPHDLDGVDGLIMTPGSFPVPSRFHLLGCFKPPQELPEVLQEKAISARAIDPEFCAWHAKSYDRAIDPPSPDTLLLFPPQSRKYVLQDWSKDIP